MPSSPTCDAQIVQATRNGDHGIGKSIRRVAELVLGNATDLDASNRMLHTHTYPSQEAVVAFLTRLQLSVLGLFFGWRCARTDGAYPRKPKSLRRVASLGKRISTKSARALSCTDPGKVWLRKLTRLLPVLTTTTFLSK